MTGGTMTGGRLHQAEQLFRAGRADQSEVLLREIAARPPAPARVFELLAFICGNRGDMAGCERYLSQAVALPGCSPEAHFYLGRVRLQRGAAGEAIACFERAMREAGEFFEAHHEIGVAHSALGKHALALAAFERAERLNDRAPELQLNLGSSLMAMQQAGRALVHFDRALALQPQLARCWSERAMALADLGRIDEAVASVARGATLAPQDVDIAMNQIALLDRAGRADAAAAALARLAAVPAPETPAFGYWLHERMSACRWEGVDALLEECCVRVRRGEAVAEPFALLPTPADSATLLACARRHAQDLVATVDPGTPPVFEIPAVGRRLRVGYFSSFFRAHPMALIIARMLECHDRTRIETFGFSFGPPISDPQGLRVKNAFEHFIDAGNLDDAQIVARAREAGIDIAIDLNGFTEGARSGLFVRRLAPLQVNFMGFPASMGAEFIDYILADAVVIPTADAAHYSEQVVRLPGSYFCNDDLYPDLTAGAQPLTRAQAGLPERGFVFACFNNTHKITPDVFAVWMRLLAAVPGSVLWLLEGHPGARPALAKAARELGIDPQRIVWAPRTGYATYVARQALADLFLDTFHYNAHTTCSDALRAGLPVLTFAGRTFASRVAASLLTAMGLEEQLVVHSMADYEARALAFAQEPGLLAAVRADLWVKRESSGVFDGTRFTRHMEAAYEAMWARRMKGLPPGHIDVRPVAG
ncbi:Beta-barrel assembly-enhancing protease [Xylophilus ampelinus]|nr:Beta-barrel assembly-enhancing protease [Xylophilus ampelinus]